ncbi:MAG: excinuclease ABC subunit UvrA [Planctomycetes bacterium]|nr:excinuclease ABC subunit UvrA [Planctomycetota bacterium]
MEQRTIRVVGARQHNLQNVSLEIPPDRLVVLTGMSGSGKSSLAFDTIYAEGQRKYVESLSVHARMFLEQVGKPDVDRIEGLPPTLAIEQLAVAPDPRSTVATTPEIYDFLRLLLARVGQPHCPKCGRSLVRRTVDQIVDEVLALPAESRVMILSPMARGKRGDLQSIVRRIQREGFVRARVNGELLEAKDLAELPPTKKVDIDVVVDRLAIRPDIRRRLADAIELSLSLGDGETIVSRAGSGNGQKSAGDEWTDAVYSEHHACSACGVSIPELAPRTFSFNSPYGACPACDGLGTMLRFDAELIVPDPDRSLMSGAIAPWSGGSRSLGNAYTKLVKSLCDAFEVKPNTPFKALPDDLRRILLHGSKPRDKEQRGIEFEGIIPNLDRRLKAAGQEASRSRFGAYQAEHRCPSCGGARLRPESLAVRIGDRNIFDLTSLSIASARAWFEGLRLPGESGKIAASITADVSRRLRFLDEVGLGYLTLDRTSATLSGGEAQRIRLATQLGAGLVGVCYVLDEPTIGLHQRDNERLLRAIRDLVNLGNTAIVVEHDEDVIRAADYLVDMGPGAGLHGGRVIAQGLPPEVIENPNSITGRYLRNEYEIPLPEQRREPKRSEFVQVVGAAENNLKNADVTFPLGVLCAVTGVSGSGKSTLVSQTLLPALRRRLAGRGGSENGGGATRPVGRHDRLVGANKIDRVIEIDQTPIGRTPRSNPATYTGVFDEIRRLYSKTKESRIRGYANSRFSFNAKGGRCEACQGHGVRRIEMHFLPDLFVECGECRGTRYNRETLEIRYKGKSIADVLEMRVEESIKFFDSFARIKAGLQALSDVGLGYVRLGQPSNTLSGGEAQRVKLAAELAKPASGHTLYVLDEPTTGLHFADIDTLLAVLNRLVDFGNTVLVIEHNLDVIKTADWVIDLGPDGGDDGGRVVAEGTPEQIAACKKSHTGRYLARKLRSPAGVNGSRN